MEQEPKEKQAVCSSAPATGYATVHAHLREIAVLEARIAELNQASLKCIPQGEVRKAEPEDIRIGALVWYRNEDRETGWAWFIVREVMNPRNEFKAYVCNEGCRRGLYGAFVESHNEKLNDGAKPGKVGHE